VKHLFDHDDSVKLFHFFYVMLHLHVTKRVLITLNVFVF